MKTTSHEDKLEGRQHCRKTASQEGNLTEDNNIGRKPQIKAASQSKDLTLRQPERNITLQ